MKIKCNYTITIIPDDMIKHINKYCNFFLPIRYQTFDEKFIIHLILQVILNKLFYPKSVLTDCLSKNYTFDEKFI